VATSFTHGFGEALGEGGAVALGGGAGLGALLVALAGAVEEGLPVACI
jgi:hypothetical protein